MDLGQQHQKQQQGSLRTATVITDLAVVVDVVGRNLAVDVDNIGRALAVVVDVGSRFLAVVPGSFSLLQVYFLFLRVHSVFLRVHFFFLRVIFFFLRVEPSQKELVIILAILVRPRKRCNLCKISFCVFNDVIFAHLAKSSPWNDSYNCRYAEINGEGEIHL